MSGVKSFIAHLEKKNEEIRQSGSPGSSPKSRQDKVTSFRHSAHFSNTARIEFPAKPVINETNRKKISVPSKESKAIKPVLTSKEITKPIARSKETVAKTRSKSNLSSPKRPSSLTQLASLNRKNRIQAKLDEKTNTLSPPTEKKTLSPKEQLLARLSEKTSPTTSPSKSHEKALKLATAINKSNAGAKAPPRDDPNDPNSPSARNLRNLQQKTSFHQRLLGLADQHMQHKEQTRTSNATTSPIPSHNMSRRSTASVSNDGSLSLSTNQQQCPSPARAVRSLSPKVHRRFQNQRQRVNVGSSSPNDDPVMNMRSYENNRTSERQIMFDATSNHNHHQSIVASDNAWPSTDAFDRFQNSYALDHQTEEYFPASWPLTSDESQIIKDTSVVDSVEDDILRIQQPPSVKHRLRSKHSETVRRGRNGLPSPTSATSVSSKQDQSKIVPAAQETLNEPYAFTEARQRRRHRRAMSPRSSQRQQIQSNETAILTPAQNIPSKSNSLQAAPQIEKIPPSSSQQISQKHSSQVVNTSDNLSSTQIQKKRYRRSPSQTSLSRRHQEKRQLLPSVKGDTPDAMEEDDITLTSVRQIVETLYDSTSQQSGGKSSMSALSQKPKSFSTNNVQRAYNRDNDVAFDEKKSESLRMEGLKPNPSSSDYDAAYDTEDSRDINNTYNDNDDDDPQFQHRTQHQSYLSMSASAMTPEVLADNVNGESYNQQHNDTSYSERNATANERKITSSDDLVTNVTTTRVGVDDDGMYDFGLSRDYDDNNSHYGTSFEQRRLKQERESKNREKSSVTTTTTKNNNELNSSNGNYSMNKEKLEQYRRSLDTPLTRTGVGVAAAATVGFMVMGPVGLLVGAAVVGIGVGYMEIPEEQRQNIQSKAGQALANAKESAVSTTEKLTYSCASTYHDSGISDHVPVEIQTCCTDLGITGAMDEDEILVDDQDRSVAAIDDKLQSRLSRDWATNGTRGTDAVARKQTSPQHHHHPGQYFRDNKSRGKVACLRKGKIVAVAHIYSLDPSMQPRAWVDVLASADATIDERIEAMEEILILGKDKSRARIFVEEGILDSIMWTIERYLEKSRRGPGWENWVHREITKDETKAAKLAANCCLTLGKSYCAAIHTEGDLLLMSLYERGTVPEERQLAQMLHEVPHHSRTTQTTDPTIVTPGHEVFALKQLTLPQAEELAATIYALALGQQEV